MDREDWNARYNTTDLLWHEEPNQFLVEQVTDLSPGRALDLACGEGRNAIWLAEQGWETTGIDFSSVALEKARAFANRRGVAVSWVEADLSIWQPEDATFDLVVAAYVQLPGSQRKELHRRAFEAVGIHGRLLVIAHDSANLLHGTGGPQNPDVLFTADDVIEDLRGSPFLVERAGSVTRRVTTPEGDRDAIDVLVRLRKNPTDKESIYGNR